MWANQTGRKSERKEANRSLFRVRWAWNESLRFLISSGDIIHVVGLFRTLCRVVPSLHEQHKGDGVELMVIESPSGAHLLGQWFIHDALIHNHLMLQQCFSNAVPRPATEYQQGVEGVELKKKKGHGSCALSFIWGK